MKRLRWVWGTALAVLFLLYLAGVFRTRVTLTLLNVPASTEARFLPTVAGLTTSIIADGKVTGFWDDVDSIYASRLALVRGARHSIRYETYYVTPGRRADAFAAALAERARAGVKVEIVVDSQGSWAVKDTFWDPLRAAGADVRFFSAFSFRNPRHYGFRTHRKLLLVDGKQVQIGGIGLSDEWDGTGPQARWADVEVRAIGPVVNVLGGIFEQHWMHEDGVADLTPQAHAALPPTGGQILVTPGDPSRGDSSIRNLLHAAILAARKRLWLASPYFLPNTNARDTFQEARQRGVQVRILTEGPSNDNPVAYHASRSLYADLLQAGVEIYEYQPAMMHAKAVLVDDGWVSTGSANFDPRTLFHNDELNISMADPALARRFEGFFIGAFARSRRITQRDLDQRSLPDRLLGLLGYAYRWQL
jgi:cardiolipin synthase